MLALPEKVFAIAEIAKMLEALAGEQFWGELLIKMQVAMKRERDKFRLWDMLNAESRAVLLSLMPREWRVGKPSIPVNDAGYDYGREMQKPPIPRGQE